jgi:hypothetical protein
MAPVEVQDRALHFMRCPDSSSDEEGPSATSIYWQLPRSHRSHYKPILRAFRRAHNRHIFLQAHGCAATDLVPAGTPDSPQHMAAGHPGNGTGGVKVEVLDLKHGRCRGALPLVDTDSLAMEALRMLIPHADAQGAWNAACCMHHDSSVVYMA